MTIFLLMFFIGQSDAQTVVYNIPQGQTINQGNAACGSGGNYSFSGNWGFQWTSTLTTTDGCVDTFSYIFEVEGKKSNPGRF